MLSRRRRAPSQATLSEGCAKKPYLFCSYASRTDAAPCGNGACGHACPGRCARITAATFDGWRWRAHANTPPVPYSPGLPSGQRSAHPVVGRYDCLGQAHAHPALSAYRAERAWRPLSRGYAANCRARRRAQHAVVSRRWLSSSADRVTAVARASCHARYRCRARG